MLGNPTAARLPTQQECVLVTPCAWAPEPVATDALFTSLGIGNLLTCGLTTGGSVQCWGWDLRGELGDTWIVGGEPPVQISLPGPAEALAVGGAHACVLLRIGDLWCWGHNGSGQAGSTDEGLLPPTRVDTDIQFREIAAGVDHTCGLTESGIAYCWGSNRHGQLGANIDMSSTPLPVSPPATP